MGNGLQFQDSQLTVQVMLRFMKKDIPILLVHDSFIIIRGLSHELKDVMEEELKKMLNVPVTIDNKPMIVPEGKTP